MKCPACGQEVENWRLICDCGYQFAAAAPPEITAAVAALAYTEEKPSELERHLRNWGLGIGIFGVFSLVEHTYFDPVAGALLLVAGGLAVLIQQRPLLLLLGVSLILAGFFNAGTGLRGAFSVLNPQMLVAVITGVIQVALGLYQIRMFRHYRP